MPARSEPDRYGPPAGRERIPGTVLDLTPAAALAWQLGAAEAARADHARITPVHLVVGVLSLEKLRKAQAEAAGLSAEEIDSLRRERATIADLLAGLRVRPAVLRRRLRHAAGRGPGAPPGPVSRSTSAKNAFARAQVLAASGPVSTLHLLAALGELRDAALEEGLADAGLQPRDLAARARALAGFTERVASLEGFLRQRLVGQSKAVERVARRLVLVHSAPAGRRGPLAVFLFLGPRGVGRTRLARLLAEHLFGNGSELVRLAMREYEDPAAVERLFGGAAHEEGRLARALREEPRAVVQLDEIEAAHPLVLSALQRLLTEGRLELGGTTTDGREAIFVLSSNVDATAVDEAASLEAAREALGPELLGRLDEVVAFEPLGPAETAAILRPRLAELVASGPSRHGVTLRIDAEAERFLLEAGTSPEQGARELFPTFERLAEAPLTSLAASGKLARASAWRLAYDEGGVYWLPDE
jgi:hypothetical protein